MKLHTVRWKKYWGKDEKISDLPRILALILIFCRCLLWLWKSTGGEVGLNDLFCWRWYQLLVFECFRFVIYVPLKGAQNTARARWTTSIFISSSSLHPGIPLCILPAPPSSPTCHHPTLSTANHIEMWSYSQGEDGKVKSNQWSDDCCIILLV